LLGTAYEWLAGWIGMILSWRHALLYLAPLIGHFLRHPLTVAIGIVDFGDHRRDLADFRVVPTVNPKQPSIACESVDNHGDGRSPKLIWYAVARAVPISPALQTEVLALGISSMC
jgi:hypothetical protein